MADMKLMAIIAGILGVVFSPVMIIAVGVISLIGLPFGLLYRMSKKVNLGQVTVLRPVLRQNTAH
jgi:hypothetical protein